MTIGEISASIKLDDDRTIEIQGRLLELDYGISDYDSIRLEIISKEFKVENND